MSVWRDSGLIQQSSSMPSVMAKTESGGNCRLPPRKRAQLPTRPFVAVQLDLAVHDGRAGLAGELEGLELVRDDRTGDGRADDEVVVALFVRRRCAA